MSNEQVVHGIVTGIQAVDMTVSDKLKIRVSGLLAKFQRQFPEIGWADFYLRQSPKLTAAPRALKLRLGVPGPDIFVMESGKNWKQILNNVESKIIWQLQKRKARN